MSKFANFMKRLITFLLIISLIVVILLTVRKLYLEKAPPPPPVVEESSSSSVTPDKPDLPSSHSLKAGIHDHLFAVGKLGPNDERKEYISGDIMLHVPRLGLMAPVLSIPLEERLESAQTNGTSDYDTQVKLMDEMNSLLDEGVTLFNESATPGIGNRNVSIAGHRDTKNKEFYYIDTITDGDLIYLTYQNRQYVYEYETTFITDENDWEPIKSKDYNLLTLQSCDPILPPSGIYDRIFVTARLREIIFLDPDEFESFNEITSQGPSLPAESDVESSTESELESSSGEEKSSNSETSFTDDVPTPQ